MQRCHQSHSSITVETGQIILTHAAIDVTNGRPGVSGEATIDTSNKLVHLFFQISILFHISMRGNRDLQQCYLAKQRYTTCMTDCNRWTCIVCLK